MACEWVHGGIPAGPVQNYLQNNKAWSVRRRACSRPFKFELKMAANRSQVFTVSNSIASFWKVHNPVQNEPNGLELGTSRRDQKKQWNSLQKLGATVLDAVEKTVFRLESERPVPSTCDPAVQLSGNFRPVPEMPVKHELTVEGVIPVELEGIYLRNGANPLFQPSGGHHLFDGDGMIHAVTLRAGKASYACRLTETERLVTERRLGRSFYPKPVGELHGHAGLARLMLYYARALCGLVDPAKGMGVANAGLVYFNGRLLAMSEDDKPYAVHITEDGDLQTAGRFDFDGQLSDSMIAHPSIDPRTGELFVLSYNILQRPFLKYFRFGPDGSGPRPVDITLREPTMIHDFAITEKYIVVPDQQMVFDLRRMLAGGSPVLYNEKKVPRFGVMPRYDGDESRVVWIDVPDCFCFHLWNSWEENQGEEIVVIASCMTPPDGVFNEHPDKPFKSILSEIRLNLRTGSSVRREIVAGVNLEAGQINRNYVGVPTRFVYMAIAEPWPRVSGIAKVDLQEKKVVGKVVFQDGCYGGEPYFVPRGPDSSCSEDDGFVVTFVHNEVSGESEFVILDAMTEGLDRLASVKLPSRVPYGFHATFVPHQELRRQKCSA
ncbi:hypothetical protein SUGI_0782720 [Cryptomeria japonica]|uniref:9-cis-epoxycarotenoid dioxygenase NCED3, chloroplastic n=1 Tax=Cryptomeria japonica TaxID=3369 RepID=UPI0024146A5E|nr:9-cis-epoxycarotenoid dioxygenase NCED3, chloroplastic [Cryptomeria japonica]GLJ38434.1 hypothetical protein SUGI_0782720 [Cryptomeria japonica]